MFIVSSVLFMPLTSATANKDRIEMRQPCASANRLCLKMQQHKAGKNQLSPLLNQLSLLLN